MILLTYATIALSDFVDLPERVPLEKMKQTQSAITCIATWLIYARWFKFQFDESKTIEQRLVLFPCEVKKKSAFWWNLGHFILLLEFCNYFMINTNLNTRTSISLKLPQTATEKILSNIRFEITFSLNQQSHIARDFSVPIVIKALNLLIRVPGFGEKNP